ncbi:MAG: glyoxalase [Cytophagaceae bacterium]|nr:glyoxalase [Cytophagaceae bacterium]
MTSSRNDLLKLRPEIPSIQQDLEMSPEEAFQNQTIRPILKFQNDLLLAIYAEHVLKHKSIFYKLTIPKRLEFVKESLQKDPLLKHTLIGAVIGLFTNEEFGIYLEHEKELKRRISDMLVQRFQDQIGYFDE